MNISEKLGNTINKIQQAKNETANKFNETLDNAIKQRQETISSEHEFWVEKYSKPQWQDPLLQEKKYRLENIKKYSGSILSWPAFFGGLDFIAQGIQETNLEKTAMGIISVAFCSQLLFSSNRASRQIETMNEVFNYSIAKEEQPQQNI